MSREPPTRRPHGVARDRRRIIATEGLGKLTLRRLAHEVGTSTMAIYTHFGGMTELRREIRREGFARLGAREAAVATTGDPVADVWALGVAYYGNAIQNPNLYQAMFMDGPVDEADADAGLETFGQLVTAVQRCIDAGRFEPQTPSAWPRSSGRWFTGWDARARAPVALRSGTPLPRSRGAQPIPCSATIPGRRLVDRPRRDRSARPCRPHLTTGGPAGAGRRMMVLVHER